MMKIKDRRAWALQWETVGKNKYMAHISNKVAIFINSLCCITNQARMFFIAYDWLEDTKKLKSVDIE